MGREPSSSPFLSHHHHHHILPGSVLADHPHLLLLGFPSFAAAASVTLSLASCLSHQFARPTAILLQELLHLLFPTAGSSLTVASRKTPLAPTPVVAALLRRAATGPSFPASVSVAAISLLPPSSSSLPPSLLPRHP